jgi:hypothetical protein
MRHRRLKSDRGVAIVEFALVLPLIMGLVLGIFEFGTAWRATNTIERSVQNAGRAASNAGDGRFADYDALRAVDATLAGSQGIDVEKVVIYKSNAAGDLPPGCDTGDVASVCNNYTAAQVTESRPFVGFQPGSGVTCPGSWDVAWCPLGRDNDRGNLPPGTDSDYIGVYVEASYEPVTGLLSSNFKISRKAVFLLEPPSIGS